VDVAREKLLACTALAENEHRRQARGGLRRHVDDAPEGRRAADDFAVGEPLDLVLERFVLRDQLLPLGCLAHALDDRDALERLLDEVVCAVTHRAHGRLDGAIRGHQDDLYVWRDLLDRAKKLQAGRARHHQVGEHDVHAVGPHEFERALRVRCR
jgi:hypothetical protein